MSFFSINYCLLLPADTAHEVSPLQGFPADLIERAWVFRTVVHLFPPTLLELYRPSVATIQQRLELWKRAAQSPCRDILMIFEVGE